MGDGTARQHIVGATLTDEFTTKTSSPPKLAAVAAVKERV